FEFRPRAEFIVRRARLAGFPAKPLLSLTLILTVDISRVEGEERLVVRPSGQRRGRQDKGKAGDNRKGGTHGTQCGGFFEEFSMAFRPRPDQPRRSAQIRGSAALTPRPPDFIYAHLHGQAVGVKTRRNAGSKSVLDELEARDWEGFPILRDVGAAPY